jgi:hypothetical protein
VRGRCECGSGRHDNSGSECDCFTMVLQ